MGDHGGGQPNVYGEVAKKLDAKYAPKGIHVFYCDEVYTKAQGDFDKWLAGERLSGQLARRHSRHVGDAVSRRRRRGCAAISSPTAVGDTCRRAARRATRTRRA